MHLCAHGFVLRCQGAQVADVGGGHGGFAAQQHEEGCGVVFDVFEGDAWILAGRAEEGFEQSEGPFYVAVYFGGGVEGRVEALAARFAEAVFGVGVGECGGAVCLVALVSVLRGGCLGVGGIYILPLPW